MLGSGRGRLFPRPRRGYRSSVDMSRSERAEAVLRRIIALATGVMRVFTKLAVVAGASVATAWLVWLLEAVPADTAEWVVRLVVLVAVLVPPGILLLFVAGLREVLELPERLRGLPANVRSGVLEVRERSRRTSDQRGVLGAVTALVRLGRIVLGSRELLSPYAVVAAALRPTILLAALLMAVVAAIEIPAAALVVVLILAA